MRFRWLAFATLFMSIPLFASYPIKHVLFAPGYGFVAMYTWGLVAVPTLPALLLAEIVLILVYRSRHVNPASLRIHALAAIVGVVAEAVFLLVRTYA